jgi:hypothetical protein
VLGARTSLRFLVQALALRALAQQHQAELEQQQQQQQQQVLRLPMDRAIAAEGAARYAQLMSLCVVADVDDDEHQRTLPFDQGGMGTAAERFGIIARELLPALSAALGAASVPSEAEVAALLSREQANSFAVETPAYVRAAGFDAAAAASAAPAAPLPRWSRIEFGGALYARASLVNHECLPNVARFDDFADAKEEGSPARGRLRLVALHALPRGTELALCYAPLRWGRASRQGRLRRVYGFECACARCALEEREDVFRGARGGEMGEEDEEEGGEWETDEGEEGDDDEWEEGEEGEEDGGAEGAGAMDAEEQEEQEQDRRRGDDGTPAQEAPADADPSAMGPTYLHLFLLKYACARKGCTGGTLAPVAPGAGGVLRCNACGGERTEAQFLAELEAGQG